MASRSKRVMKEIQDCQRDSHLTQIDIQMVDGDLTNLRGRFRGPPNSPYEGGTFEVAIEVPQRYPFEPLKMKFITKVYHPNISSQSGAICLDILKDAWSPVLTLKTTLVSLQSLLCSPEPNDPQDAEVAKVYLSDRSAFESTARYWTETYASRPTLNPSTSTSSSTNLISSANYQTRPMNPRNPSSSSPFIPAVVSNSEIIDLDPEIEIQSGLGPARSNPTAPSTTTTTTTVKTGHPSKELDDQISSFGLDRSQLARFQSMGFSVESIIRSSINLKFQNPRIDHDSSLVDELTISDEDLLEALLSSQ